MNKAKMVVSVAAAVTLDALLRVGAAYATYTPHASVPNPGTLLLLTAGLGGLAWWIRKGK